MRTLPLILALALFGCGDEELPADTTTGGGGGNGSGGGGGSRIDGGMVQTSDGGQEGFTAQLCLLTDLRLPGTCAANVDLSGIDIQIVGGAEATSDVDGFFSLPLPDGAPIIFLEVGFDTADMHNALVPINTGASNPRVALVEEATWESLVQTVGLLETDGTASIAAYISDNGSPLVGAEMIPPAGGAAPVYDGPNNPEDWASGAVTGAQGAAIMTNVPTTLSDVSFSISAGGNLQIVDTVPVVDDALTFVFFELP